jgi:hypothetical protein
MFLRTSGVKPLYICMAVAFLTVFGACHEEVVSAATPESGPSPDREAPSVPGDVGATALALDRIEVSWSASSDNVGVTGYRIERDGSVAHETAQTSWSDEGLESGSTHAYRVLAFDEAGNLSDWSAVASATTPDDDPEPQDVWYVGPDRTYKTITQVAPLLEPGDLVLVDGGHVYAGAIMFSVPGTAGAPITIRGVRVNGSRPVIEGGRDVVEFNMNHYVFEGFEIQGAGFRGLFHHADDITIRDCVVHDCPHGILGADQGSGDCTLEYCEIYHNGEGDGRHQIYMSTNEDDYPGSVFRMQFCYVHDGTGGNNVKSRAERNEIYYNWLETPYYHNLELIGPDPYGGVAQDRAREDSDVAGNVLITQRYPRNVRIGGDSDGAGSYGRYRFVNNTFIHRNGDPRSHIFAHFGVESVEMHNNVFYIGSHTVFDDSECEWASGRRVSGANNWVLTGATYPGEWTGTLTGSSPGFIDIDAGLFVPAAGSVLLDAGVSETVSPAGSPFPDPLPLPLYLPPQRMLIAPGTGQLRPVSVIIDIGAFEGN